MNNLSVDVLFEGECDRHSIGMVSHLESVWGEGCVALKVFMSAEIRNSEHWEEIRFQIGSLH